MSVDNETGNIYLADRDNNCAKVFDSTGKYLFNFGDNEDEVKIYSKGGGSRGARGAIAPLLLK